MRPLNDYVLLELLKGVDASQRRINLLMSGDGKRRPTQEYAECLVVAVGPGRLNEDGQVIRCEVVEGDIVQIHNEDLVRGSGLDMPERHYLVREDVIRAVLS